jgi:glycine cleavage system H lipoate-binding protein
MGITRFALQRLENIVYIDTGRKGDTFETGSLLASLETSKSVTEIYSPCMFAFQQINCLTPIASCC